MSLQGKLQKILKTKSVYITVSNKTEKQKIIIQTIQQMQYFTETNEIHQ